MIKVVRLVLVVGSQWGGEGGQQVRVVRMVKVVKSVRVVKVVRGGHGRQRLGGSVGE